MKKVLLPIKGMHCASCVSRIENKLQSVEGVDTASVNLVTEQASVSFDEQKTDEQKLKEAVRETGYDVYED